MADIRDAEARCKFDGLLIFSEQQARIAAEHDRVHGTLPYHSISKEYKGDCGFWHVAPDFKSWTINA